MSAISETSIKWLNSQGYTPHGFQLECWAKVSAQLNGLLMAQTGSGKTYALGLPMLLQAEA